MSSSSPPTPLSKAPFSSPTNRPRNTQSITIPYPMDHYCNDEVGAFNDAVDNFMKGHIDALLLPQYSSPPSPGNGVCVPQRLCKKGTGRDAPKNQHGLPFILEDGLYLPVTMALEEQYIGLMHRDSQVLNEVGDTVMIRIEWPGYRSKVYQLRTLDWCAPPKKITLSKLATEISKVIRKFIVEMQGEPIEPNYTWWRVGQNGIQVQHLRLAAFEQVDTGSLQVRIFYTPPHY